MDSRRHERMDIGCFQGQGNRKCPQLITWSQFKKMREDHKFDDISLELLFDYNSCFMYGFRKFAYDPYSGEKIDWGRISEEISDMLGKKVLV